MFRPETNLEFRPPSACKTSWSLFLYSRSCTWCCLKCNGRIHRSKSNLWLHTRRSKSPLRTLGRTNTCFIQCIGTHQPDRQVARALLILCFWKGRLYGCRNLMGCSTPHREWLRHYYQCQQLAPVDVADCRRTQWRKNILNQLSCHREAMFTDERASVSPGVWQGWTTKQRF